MMIQFLYFPGCPAAPLVREALHEALRQLGIAGGVEEVNLETLGWRDARRGWGSPTILVGGRDLFGREAPTCTGVGARHYPEGVPGAAELIQRLSRVRGADSAAA